ncbi:MAG TPA: prepilin-type N-terminal cleavage/methylation domain-containing protein [Polyangiaceae bacterium]|jgi:prepilin-type N-terminal cleavage/methylation domain-containing protein|nr:prepilin-type N-terminal cleavage/methylation domain-containing protein [Polyangiaceae bacterium]
MNRGARAARRARSHRGYTIVELMMAITVFGIGVAGIISMEKVTSASNQHAKNLAIATHIAESWLDMLHADASTWNHPSPGYPIADLGTDTVWLQGVVSNAGANSWFLPAWNTQLGFGPAFDALGNPINTTNGDLSNVAFCSNLRLSYLFPPNPSSGNGLIRAEVRVFWLRDGQTSPQAGTNMCATTMPTNLINGATNVFHFVQKITAIRENTTP